MMTRSPRIPGLGYLVLALSPFVADTVTAQSVYVLYASDSSKQMKELKRTLAEKVTVKSYNVKLLALADYSGKQKAVARFDKSDLVIILGKSALKPMKGSKFQPPVLVLDTSRKGVSSEAQLLYVVNGKTNVQKLGSKVTKVSADQMGKMTRDAIADTNVVVVDRSSKTTEWAAVLVGALLAE